MYKELKNIFEGRFKDADRVDALPDFHPQGTQMVLKDDDYFLGNRADHFVLVNGYSEEYGDALMVICNHKGTLIIEYYVNKK